jgi:lysine-specific demethylase 8
LLFGLHLLGAVKQWPAYKLWTNDYLKHTYGDMLFNMETKDDDKLNIPKSMKLKEFLEIYQQADRYLVDEVPPDMRKEIIMPLCMRCEEIDRYFFVSYFWFSQGNTSSTIHLDTDENMLCVVKGHKEVLMVSPEYSADLYTDSSRILGVLDINVASVNLVKYPRIKNVHYVKANVDEGDMVYIPQMWWHHVYSR